MAADWSDTSISWSYGNKFAEPYEGNDISKNIFSLTHSSGYAYGTNFFNVDLLQSDSKDPASVNQRSGAQEAYVVYRNTIDIGKVIDKDLSTGPVRGFGALFGFDWNTKNDVGYNSRKRLLVLGPTVMWDVPGFLNTSLVLLHESNAPSSDFAPISNVHDRYTYKTRPGIEIAWGIPIGSYPLSFEGYTDIRAPKGRDEVGNETTTETLIDMRLMWDVGVSMRMKKNTFKVGLEYQYWKNKFGNSEDNGGDGTFAKTPIVRAEYHF